MKEKLKKITKREVNEILFAIIALIAILGVIYGKSLIAFLTFIIYATMALYFKVSDFVYHHRINNNINHHRFLQELKKQGYKEVD